MCLFYGIKCANFVGKIFGRKPSSDSESSSLATTPSEKLGGHQSDSSSAVTGHVEPLETVSQDTTQVCIYMLMIEYISPLYCSQMLVIRYLTMYMPRELKQRDKIHLEVCQSLSSKKLGRGGFHLLEMGRKYTTLILC